MADKVCIVISDHIYYTGINLLLHVSTVLTGLEAPRCKRAKPLQEVGVEAGFNAVLCKHQVVAERVLCLYKCSIMILGKMSLKNYSVIV